LKSEIPQLAHALNLGIEAASFNLIARMDADDIAWPQRFEKQLEYMVKNGLDMVGCDLRLVDETGHPTGRRIYPKGEQINRCLSFRNCFAHNTLLIKRSILVKARGYNAGFNTEDYDLWLRMRRLDVKWDNMNETLVDYRIHDAASQRQLLGYAEATALAMREFMLMKTFTNLFAIGYHFVKSLIRSKHR
jgi:glycosyltransferase involved in cell wall biosynthesis